ncbi:kinase-like protein [Pleomassaria siparia CBS 279.74]|uniref:non-specific serine/threonine protein kinase n=1 Tax=Pleomassaria siparia CBS 279.74 TaxID=1314801 RepID=A0A6G1JSU2_9PLEO|nr:kinase-like protein [Pleomassaria siparia CBS 279.74]
MPPYQDHLGGFGDYGDGEMEDYDDRDGMGAMNAILARMKIGGDFAPVGGQRALEELLWMGGDRGRFRDGEDARRGPRVPEIHTRGNTYIPGRVRDYDQIQARSNMHAVFEVVKDLGESGGGCNDSILVVRSRRSGREYVEKQMSGSLVSRGFAKSEIDFLKQLQGEANTIKMENFLLEEDSRIASIIMEQCDWGSCRDLIKRHHVAEKNISERWLWKAFLQMAEAIKFLHYGPYGAHDWNSVLHMDMKPDNVLIQSGHCTTPNIKVADFGSAMGGDKGLTVSRSYTPCYKAPEKEATKKADIWGIGIVMLCMCRLSSRFKRDRHAGSTYSQQLNDAVYECLRWSPRYRIRSENLAHRLSGLVARVDKSMLRGNAPIPPSGL